MVRNMLQSYHAGDDHNDHFQGYVFKDFNTKKVLGQWSIGGKAGIPYIGREVAFRIHDENRTAHNMKVLYMDQTDNHITIVWVVDSKTARELGAGKDFSGANFGKVFLV